MHNSIRKKWFSIDSKLKYDLKIYSNLDKKKNEETIDGFKKKFEDYLKKKPRSKSQMKLWELDGERVIQEFIKEDSLLNLKVLDEKVQKNIIKITKDFIRKAKEFDKDLKGEDISQGLRNILVIILLQLIFGEEVKLTSSGYAYSILYPYTDNYLDNTNISMEDKRLFNDKISLMIEGEEVSLKSELERKVYLLLKNIEVDYNRQDSEDVYKSLLKIHKGQVKSMNQQQSSLVPYVDDILDISIEKGAASVLADGYLVKGNLNELEREFCSEYGFLLQLIDDFQDLKGDKEDNHITIFTQLAERYNLDAIVNKLINFVLKFFEEAIVLKDKNNLKTIMKENSLLLILCSLAINKKYLSKEYMIEMEKYLPLSISYIERFSKIAMKKVNKLEGIL